MDKNKISPISTMEVKVNFCAWNRTEPGRTVSWGPREIEEYELIFIRRGRYRYLEHSESGFSFPRGKGEEDGSFSISAGPGELLIIPPGTTHTFGAITEKGEYAFIHHKLNLTGGEENSLRGIDPPPRYITPFREDYRQIVHDFTEIIKLYQSYEPLKEELLCNLCRNIWLNCGRRWTLDTGGNTPSGRMERMLEYIRSNCTSPLDRRELGRAFNLTPEYINALFKKELGMSPGECINRERIFQAYTHIYNEGCSVKEAAFRSGFNDPLYFSRVFKKITGLSPGTLKGREFFHEELTP